MAKPRLPEEPAGKGLFSYAAPPGRPVAVA
jgi:hypothetical protein